MHAGQTVLTQLMQYLPLQTFRVCVARYRGDQDVRGFSCLDQFRTLAFAQLTAHESLRDIETAVTAHQAKLYHMGFRWSEWRHEQYPDRVHRLCDASGVSPSAAARPVL